MTPCPGCNKKATVTQFTRPTPRSNPQAVAARSHVTADDSQFVLVKYATKNLSQHHVYGTAQFEYLMQIQPGMFLRMERHSLGGYRFYYGYHGGGELFTVHRNDAELESKFEPIEPVRRERHVEIEPPIEEREPTPAPKRMTIEDVLGGGELRPQPDPSSPPVPPPSEAAEDQLRDELAALEPAAYDKLSTMLVDEVKGEDRPWAIQMIKDKMDEQHDPLDKTPIISYSNNSDDLQRLPGIGNSLANALRADGYATIEELISLGVDGIQDYKGVGAVKAERIIGAARSLMSK